MLFRTRFAALDSQSDEKLLALFSRVLGRENKRKAEFLIYLSVIDARRLYAKEGYSSFFAFLTEKHGFSESSALKRIQASRLAHRYPFLFEEIASGKRTLSALSRLAPFVTDANAHLLFTESLGKSVREVERILARRFPEAATPDRLIKPLRALSEDIIQVSFTAGVEFEKDLLEAKALLSHRFPEGKLGDVLGMALKSLLKDLKKAKGMPKKVSNIPRGMDVESKPSGNSTLTRATPLRPTFTKVPRASRYIPREMRAAIWKRDQGCCSFRKPDGSFCGETHFLEIDHRWPFALGGSHSCQNLRLLCRTHNLLAAEHFFDRRVASLLPAQAVSKGGTAQMIHPQPLPSE